MHEKKKVLLLHDQQETFADLKEVFFLSTKCFVGKIKHPLGRVFLLAIYTVINLLAVLTIFFRVYVRH